MQRTDNFNLIVVEGSDTVNLLTQMNPNTEVIDEQMFKNQNAGVQTATELLSGTVHAITRSIPDASMIRFTAVSRFTAGDTFTVDGVQVSALLPSGEQLPDGAYIIGSEVLCVLKGTLLTVFASGGAVVLAKNAEKLGGELPSYYATKAEVDSAQETADSAGSLIETLSEEVRNLEVLGDWKLHRSTTGKATIAFPAVYKELYIKVSYSSNAVSTIIPKGSFSSTYIEVLGQRGTAEYGALVARLEIATNGVRLNDAYYGASSMSEVSSNANVYVYYR